MKLATWVASLASRNTEEMKERNMRTLRIAILAFGLAALATTGCSKKTAPAAPAPEPTTEPVEAAPAEGNPCAAPAEGAENPCAAPAEDHSGH